MPHVEKKKKGPKAVPTTQYEKPIGPERPPNVAPPGGLTPEAAGKLSGWQLARSTKYNRDGTVSVGIGGRNYDLSKAEFRATLPTRLRGLPRGQMTPQVQ